MNSERTIIVIAPESILSSIGNGLILLGVNPTLVDPTVNTEKPLADFLAASGVVVVSTSQIEDALEVYDHVLYGGEINNILFDEGEMKQGWTPEQWKQHFQVKLDDMLKEGAESISTKQSVSPFELGTIEIYSSDEKSIESSENQTSILDEWSKETLHRNIETPELYITTNTEELNPAQSSESFENQNSILDEWSKETLHPNIETSELNIRIDFEESNLVQPMASIPISFEKEMETSLDLNEIQFSFEKEETVEEAMFIEASPINIEMDGNSSEFLKDQNQASEEEFDWSEESEAGASWLSIDSIEDATTELENNENQPISENHIPKTRETNELLSPPPLPVYLDQLTLEKNEEITLAKPAAISIGTGIEVPEDWILETSKPKENEKEVTPPSFLEFKQEVEEVAFKPNAHISEVVEHLDKQNIPEESQQDSKETEELEQISVPEDSEIDYNIIQDEGAVLILGGIGAPGGIASLLPHLDVKLPVPVIVKIFLPQGHYDKFTLNLAKRAKMSVQLAEPGQILEPGIIWVLPEELEGLPENCGWKAMEANSGESILAAGATQSVIIILSGTNEQYIMPLMESMNMGIMMFGSQAYETYEPTVLNQMTDMGLFQDSFSNLGSHISERWGVLRS